MSRSISAGIAADLGRVVDPPRHLLASAGFMAHARGPSRRFFNFADGGPDVDPYVPCRGWLVGRAADAALVADLRRGLWSRLESLPGTPAVSHGHMDVGSFVVEAAGRRWIHDLGADKYNLPGYFEAQRWDYFRLNARSHIVVHISDRMQNPACAFCRITASRLDRPTYPSRA